MISQEQFILGVAILGLVFFLWFTFDRPKGQKAYYLKKTWDLKNWQITKNTQNTQNHEKSLMVKKQKKTRQLNLIFMYNGHSFDAYEVLGVPAGAEKNIIEKAYQDIKKKQNSKDQNLVDLAYQFLTQNKK